MHLKSLISGAIVIAMAFGSGCASTLSQLSDTHAETAHAACSEPMESSLGLPIPTGNPLAYEHATPTPASCPRGVQVAGR